MLDKIFLEVVDVCFKRWVLDNELDDFELEDVDYDLFREEFEKRCIAAGVVLCDTNNKLSQEQPLGGFLLENLNIKTQHEVLIRFFACFDFNKAFNERDGYVYGSKICELLDDLESFFGCNKYLLNKDIQRVMVSFLEDKSVENKININNIITFLNEGFTLPEDKMEIIFSQLFVEQFGQLAKNDVLKKIIEDNSKNIINHNYEELDKKIFKKEGLKRKGSKL